MTWNPSYPTGRGSKLRTKFVSLSQHQQLDAGRVNRVSKAKQLMLIKLQWNWPWKTIPYSC